MHEAPILICYDGSDAARDAIVAAAALLGRRQAVVLDVGPLDVVAESVAAGYAFDGYPPYGADPEETDRLVADAALACAAAGAELARAAGFLAEARAEIDAPAWRGIVDVADQIDAAVIVIGSRGLTGIRELVEGSVSHQVAVHAGRPVLTVPPSR